MRRNISVRLGAQTAAFLGSLVAQGRFRSASDAVRAGLWLLEAEEARLAALRASLIEGEGSGRSRPFDLEAFIARKRGRKPKAAVQAGS